jgi:hypothetical protein
VIAVALLVNHGGVVLADSGDTTTDAGGTASQPNGEKQQAQVQHSAERLVTRRLMQNTVSMPSPHDPFMFGASS